MKLATILGIVAVVLVYFALLFTLSEFVAYLFNKPFWPTLVAVFILFTLVGVRMRLVVKND